MGEGDVISAKLTGEMSMSGMTDKRIAKCYVLPPSQRSNSNLSLQPSNPLPVMGLASLHHSSNRAHLVSEIGLACRETSFFQVINHGISTQVTEAALETASDLFSMPMEGKMLLMSDDVNKAVRYGTSVKQMRDDVHFWRDFLKHYSNPLPEWVDLWPSNPHDYREKMGKYAEEVQKLAAELMGVIMESLGLEGRNRRRYTSNGCPLLPCIPGAGAHIRDATALRLRVLDNPITNLPRTRSNG